jgi:3-methyladenine DNA glycosylase AlkD
MNKNSKEVIKEIHGLKNLEKKKILQRFFKTGVGEYGEGDLFLGVTVPEIRKVVKHSNGLILKDIQELVRNEYHEIRLCGFLILVDKYECFIKRKEFDEAKRLVDFYLKNLKYANNWDLIDLSCYKILGDYLIENKSERKILYELIKSKNMWHRRAGIVSTMALIRKGDLDDTYSISKKLFKDKEDLMHKATGWLLREAGKRDETRLKEHLRQNIRSIPRTTLRYAIEKFNEEERAIFLKL